MKKKFLALLLAIIITGTIGVPFEMKSLAAGQNDIVYQSLGTDAPPTALGGYDLFACNDSYSNGQTVTSIPTILGDITLDTSFKAGKVGSGWSTWSHGFTGRVYSPYTATNVVVLTMPSSVKAFIFYVEPNNFGAFNISVQANNGTTFTKAANGTSGATGFGFYTQGDEYITSVTISTPSGANGFALGEFYVNKEIPVAPTAPNLSATYNSITAQAVTGCEYSLDNINWTDSNTFTTGIDPNKQYTVYIRYKATNTKSTSPSSSVQITTPKAPQDAPATPVITIADNKIIIQPIAGCEYSLDNTSWTTNNVFENLELNKNYTVYIRYIENGTAYASQSSSAMITITAITNPKSGDSSDLMYIVLVLLSCVALFFTRKKDSV